MRSSGGGNKHCNGRLSSRSVPPPRGGGIRHRVCLLCGVSLGVLHCKARRCRRHDNNNDSDNGDDGDNDDDDDEGDDEDEEEEYEYE